MTSIFHTTKSLPLSQSTTIRHRISAIQPPTISSTTAWAVCSSKSVSSIDESASNSVRNWWNLGWEWILYRIPGFALDLKMNQEEITVLGSHNKGSWRHFIYKFRSQIRKLVGSDQSVLPQTSHYKSSAI
ncbi:hypothetical protein Hanom_Chr08g00755621 [Helianthus anomalus]